jgi:hypothetical protein
MEDEATTEGPKVMKATAAVVVPHQSIVVIEPFKPRNKTTISGGPKPPTEKRVY